MARRHLRLLVTVGLAACGGDDKTCDVATPFGTLPAEGELIDPHAIALPRDCIEGGLGNLPGRWFLRDANEIFAFSYPRFEGTCEEGFRQSFVEDVHEGASLRHTWSDGTRFFQRIAYGVPVNNQISYYYVRAMALCAVADDRLAAVTITKRIDEPEPTMSVATGTPFGRKDELAKGIALVGKLEITPEGIPIEALNLVVDGTHAYVVGLDGFDIIDVANPKAPVLRAHVAGAFNDVKVVHTANKVVAVLSPQSSLEEYTFLFDVTDPSAPTSISAINEWSHSVFVQTRGGTQELYLASYESSVTMYDITDPVAPRRRGLARVPGMEGAVHDLFVDGDRIYANNTTAGFVAFDVSTGLGAPVELGRTDAPYSHASWVTNVRDRPIVLHGDEGMTKTTSGGAFLRVLDGDVTSPKFMADIGRYQSRPEVGIHNFEVHGDRAYIAYYQDGLRVVDLSDPTKPREVAHYNTWDPETAPGGAFEGALGVRVVGDLIYVADDVRGLLIFRETP